MNKTVDARGQLCPRPLILTKKALTEITTGDSLTILIDNETSKQNVEKFLSDNHEKCVTARDGGLYTLTVTKQEPQLLSPDAESYCTPAVKRPHVVVINSQTMGSGADELGTILMKAFINTIGEVSPLPSHILFYNSGIHLTCEGSPLIEPLRNLASRGVAILSCGTCLDFFGKKNTLGVGDISNMFTILETMTNADHVVTP